MIEFDKLSKREQKRLTRLEGKQEKYIESESGSYSKSILSKIFRDYRIFVLLVLYAFIKTGNEPTVLVGAVTGFLSIEVWQLARIKIKEIDKGDIDGEDRLEKETIE